MLDLVARSAKERVRKEGEEREEGRRERRGRRNRETRARTYWGILVSYR
jgi:hypothetical protein